MTYREEAVRIVDARHRATVEFSHSPEAHAAEYDEVERVLREGGVVCPDCGLGVIARLDACTNCDLSWEDLEAAAEFLGEIVKERGHER